VLRLPWYYHAARPLLQAMRSVRPLPKIPRSGDQLCYYHLFNHLARGPQGINLWREIVRHLNNIALVEGATLLTAAFDPSDRFFKLYRRGAMNAACFKIGYRPLGGAAAHAFSPVAIDVRDMD
jgi:hypothetical protein